MVVDANELVRLLEAICRLLQGVLQLVRLARVAFARSTNRVTKSAAASENREFPANRGNRLGRQPVFESLGLTR
jgi:hypothetical protein